MYRSSDGWRPKRIYAPQLFKQPETAAIQSTYNYEVVDINEGRNKPNSTLVPYKMSY